MLWSDSGLIASAPNPLRLWLLDLPQTFCWFHSSDPNGVPADQNSPPAGSPPALSGRSELASYEAAEVRAASRSVRGLLLSTSSEWEELSPQVWTPQLRLKPWPMNPSSSTCMTWMAFGVFLRCRPGYTSISEDRMFISTQLSISTNQPLTPVYGEKCK
ncbi:hypothetical protein FQA47_003513 [Oryzias melastigma]|uniref:Uncharacterized protein n=1 Tax=Oryzias melastigma TaxID=30732 RepID=A0A834C252_ORYME|nr:hypothetical protein FQA47_003513 [Oryzias melastigma]